MKTRCAALLLPLLLWAGCATTAQKLDRLQLGMTKPEVVAILGEPDATRAQANVEYLTYALPADPRAPSQTYMIRLVDARLESFGRFVGLPAEPESATPAGRPVAMGAILSYAPGRDPGAQLHQLSALHDQGVLTDAEYEAARGRLLERAN